MRRNIPHDDKSDAFGLAFMGISPLSLALWPIADALISAAPAKDCAAPSRARHGVNQSAIGFCTDVAFHSKGPLISLFALVHLGVTFPVLVLARTGRCNQGGVHRRAFPEHQAFAGQRSVDGGQDLVQPADALSAGDASAGC